MQNGSEQETPQPILQGVRVLDLTQVAAGPYATMLLGYMGAQVIKVESIARLDINRGAVTPAGSLGARYPNNDPGQRPWDRADRHVHRNANKLGITLDLATPQGKDLLLRLAAVSDILMENFRASVMDRLGLGYQEIRQANPGIVYLKVSSQGATGPEKDYGSLGSTLEQTGGLASITGYEDGIPLMTNETYPDPVVGLLSVGVAAAALRQRRLTGQGAFIDIAQREVALGLLGAAFLDYAFNGRIAGAMGNRHPYAAPQGVYPCTGEDNWLALSVETDGQWQGLCRAIGAPELADDPRFATSLARRANHDALDGIIAAWTKTRDHYQAMHLLQAHGVPAGAVAKGREVVSDPHLLARGFWDNVAHPEGFTYRQATTPWQLARNPREPTKPSAGLGEHNSLVLCDLLGLSLEELKGLESDGVIGTLPAELRGA